MIDANTSNLVCYVMQEYTYVLYKLFIRMIMLTDSLFHFSNK